MHMPIIIACLLSHVLLAVHVLKRRFMATNCSILTYRSALIVAIYLLIIDARHVNDQIQVNSGSFL